MKDWIFKKYKMPEQLKDVLILTRSGEIYKGFLNLKNTWIMANCDGLISRIIHEDSVVAWTDLPDKDDPDWKTDPQPEDRTRVLAKDSWDDELIVIAYVTKTRWIICNQQDDHITFWMHDGSAWMPLPEIPDWLKKKQAS